MKFHAIIIGPPGSGKGTQCDQLTTKYDFEHVSTGDLLRTEIKAGTALGKTVEMATKAGQLVPDEIINKMVYEHIVNLGDRSWMLDGFPRTLEQAQFLLSTGIEITHVLVLTGDEKVITERLMGRLFDPVTRKTFHRIANPPPADIIDRCITRDDDKAEVIASRFEIFRQSDAVIQSAFKEKIHIIDCSTHSIDQVSQMVEEILKQ